MKDVSMSDKELISIFSFFLLFFQMAQSTVVLEEGLFLQEKGATFEDEEKAIDPYALTDDVEPSGTPWQGKEAFI